MEIGESSVFAESELTRDEIQDFVEDEKINWLCHPTSDEDKQELADGIWYLRKLLIDHNFISGTESSKISTRSVLIGKELLKRFFNMYGNMQFSEQDILFCSQEDESVGLGKCGKKTSDIEELQTVIPTKKRKAAKDDSNTFSDSDEEVQTREKIPFAIKAKAVQLAELHPKWSINSLRSKSTKLLKDKSQLAKWKADIERGATRFDKLEVINRCVYDRFIEARDEKAGLVTTRMLKQWAMAAAFQFLDGNFEFKASDGWVTDFKSKHRISQRHVTKYISQKDKRTLDEIVETASKYQKQTCNMISNFDPDYVINTDQTGCEYRISSKRTLTHKGEKVTEIAVGQINKLTHSYTAQYALTLSGKLLPKVFICLQEITGKFGPRVQKEVNEYMIQYENVHITSTKSGKLQKHTYEEFLDEIMKPYVKTNPFLYIVDSWGGQTSADLHQMKFTDEDELPTCTLSVIPLRCTPFCQPCDVYFYRQVKNYIRHFQNAPYLLLHDKEITSREDMIKIHSLVHDQLQAPVYENMIRYAWFAAKLTTSSEREFSNNVNAVAFPEELKTKKCDCEEPEAAFIQCSWCRQFKCFDCFYNDYHPTNCTRRPE